MFCPKCRCEYPDWIKKCPNHDVTLIYSSLPDYWAGYSNISYDELLKTIKENENKLKIEVSAVDIGMEKIWQFPYQGYGYGWAVSDEGTYEHAGAAGTFIWVDPKTEVIAVILTQCPTARIPGNEFIEFVKASARKKS